MNAKHLPLALLLGLVTAAHPPFAYAQQNPAPAQAQRRPRPTPPARDPHTPGYVEAKELPDGEVPPADADGNFIIGPTHKQAPEMTRAGRRAAGDGASSSR